MAIKDKAPAVRKFVGQQRPWQRVALDDKDASFRAWDLAAVPRSFLVGKNGKIVAFYDEFDASDLPALEMDIARALKGYQPKAN